MALWAASTGSQLFWLLLGASLCEETRWLRAGTMRPIVRATCALLHYNSSMLYSACSEVASAQGLHLSQATRHAELEAIDQRLAVCGGSVEAAGFAECADALQTHIAAFALQQAPCRPPQVA